MTTVSQAYELPRDQGQGAIQSEAQSMLQMMETVQPLPAHGRDTGPLEQLENQLCPPW